MATLSERVIERSLQASDPEELAEDDDIGELDIAEYIVFLLALDTYTRYVEETAGDGAEDDLIKKGVMLIRLADRRHLAAIQEFLGSSLPSPIHQKMLGKAFKFLPTTQGLSRRSLQMRTLLSRGGATTMRSVFKTNKALQEVKAAMSAAMVDDADAALDKFAVIPLRNRRLREWIDTAAETAGSGTFQNAVVAGSKETTDDLDPIFAARAQQIAAPPASEESSAASDTHDDLLLEVQNKAQDSAERALAISGESNDPPSRAEVIGIATAAAVAAVTDPSKSTNVPAALKSLDEEQVAAALTDGRVLVAAGAGAGKSTTLVSRIDYLVKERRANPSRILACSFNKKAADELKGKIAKKLGYESSSNTGVQVGTMHSLFYKFIVGDRQVQGFGTPEEQAMLKPPRLIAPPKRGVKSVSPTSLSTAIRSIWTGCGAEPLANRFGYPLEWLNEPPKAKKANLIINRWRGNDVSLEQAKTQAKGKAEAQAAVWYELYMGVKGDIPGWKPPCISSAYDNFVNRNRKGGERLGDLDDMLKVFLAILRRDPKAKATVQGMFDHFLVDECQDLNLVQHQVFELMTEHVTDGTDGKSLWMIGDDKQCVSENTPISTPTGTTPAKDLKTGDKVLAYRNGSIVEQTIRHVESTSWKYGFQIRTESGRTLTMSPNHKIWASDPILEDGQILVYLMYRQDMGFRVGTTNKAGNGEDYLHRFGGRVFMEKAERLWVIDICTDREQALLQEETYSLQYGIPTMVFGAENRGLNQDRANELFVRFGKNGAKLLEARCLSFDLPHWISQTYTKHGRLRRTIQMIAHSSTSTQVSLEWSGGDLQDALVGVTYKSDEDRHRLRRWFSNYRQALDFAEDLQQRTGALLSRRLAGPEGALRLLTASSLFVGMEVVTQCEVGVTQERIVAVEKVDGVSFVDLDVDDASNFFGDGILSHNSIYQFRGARPELFTSLDGKDGWKTRMIRTNYRCEAEIVEAANRLVAHNEGNIPMEARANPKKGRGKASITVEMPEDNTSAAIGTIGEVVKDINVENAKAEDYAVLARTNAELNDWETACIINEIPYIRRGGKGFLEAPETKAVLGYMDLATGTNYEKMKDSLVSVLMKPDRGLFIGYEDVLRAVEEALDDVARREQVDVRAVSPTTLFRGKNIMVLADRLKQPYRLKIINSARGDTSKGEWMYKKRVEELADNLRELANSVADVRDFVEKDGSTTSELLNFILDIKSTVDGWDSVARRATRTATKLRDQITNDRAIFSDDDDGDDEEPTEQAPEIGAEGELGVKDKKDEEAHQGKGLGAVQFLYEMAVPNQNDQVNNTDPSTAQGFVAKIARYSKLSETLRIDPDKWERDQARLDASQRKAKPPAITLSTVHSVKGLEWPNVTVLMPRGKFPLMPKVKPDDPPPDPVEEAERIKAERNLAYVALTRAAVNLEIVCPLSNGVSPFVVEAGLHAGENVPKGEVFESGEKTATEGVDPHVEDTVHRFGPEFPISYDRSKL